MNNILKQRQLYLTVRFVLLALLFNFSACDRFLGDECGNLSFKTITSPGGKRKAVVFGRDCGSQGGFWTNVSILPAVEELKQDDIGNVFSLAKGGNQPEDYAKFGVRWINEGELEIDYDKSLQSYVSRAEQLFDNVKIHYK